MINGLDGNEVALIATKRRGTDPFDVQSLIPFLLLSRGGHEKRRGASLPLGNPLDMVGDIRI